MPYIISKTHGGHSWQKQNLVTDFSLSRSGDIYECTGCGLQAKGLNLTQISIDGRTALAKVNHCPGKVRDRLQAGRPDAIEITVCHAYGKQFENLTPGSRHQTIDPPEPYVDDETGVWVMGIGEPVKVLRTEYIVSPNKGDDASE